MPNFINCSSRNSNPFTQFSGVFLNFPLGKFLLNSLNVSNVFLQSPVRNRSIANIKAKINQFGNGEKNLLIDENNVNNKLTNKTSNLINNVE